MPRPSGLRLTVATINAQGGLERGLEDIRDFMSEEDIDVLCVSHSGFRHTVTGGVLGQKARDLGLIVFCNGRPEDSAGNTAVILWAEMSGSVGEILRDDSGRLLGVPISLGGGPLEERSNCLCIAAYLPPNTDSLGPRSARSGELSRDADEEFRRDLVATACGWAGTSDCCVLAGDVNFTSGPLDRMREGTRGVARALHPDGVSSCLTRELGFHGLTDVWRHCHPDAREYTFSREIEADSASVKTSSRIDRIFVTPTMLEGAHSDIIYEACAGSDHFPVKASFALVGARFPGPEATELGGEEARGAWSGDWREVSEKMRSKFYDGVSGTDGALHAAAAELTELLSRARSFPREPQSEGSFHTMRGLPDPKARPRPAPRGWDAVCTEAVSKLERFNLLLADRIESASQCLRKPATSKRPFRTKEMMELRRLKRAAGTLKHLCMMSATEEVLPIRALRKFRSHASRLARAGLLAPASASGRDRRAWLRDHSTSIIRDLRGLQRDALKKMGPSLKERLHRDPKGKKGFLARFVRGHQGSEPVRSVVVQQGDGSQRICSDPDTVQRTVKEHFRATLGNGHEGPPRTEPWYSDMYDPLLKGVNPKWWFGLMAEVRPGDLVQAIRDAPGNKAKGPDGVSINLLKLLADYRSPDPEDRKPHVAISVFALLVSVSFVCGVTPPCHGLSEIVPIPKGGKRAELDISKTRPISLISELSKIPARILAIRLTRILLRHPEILHPAQRAFLANGNAQQCIAAVLDVIEDFNESKRGCKTPDGSARELYLVSYDQSKAYDSVQSYTVQDSLRRLSLPEGFVSYVMSSMTDRKAYVRTGHGDTDTFGVETSVRQGDPLAPILFIFVNDVLHEGLERNPLFENACDGYRFHNDTNVYNRTTSAGYADDTIVISESEDGIHRLHEWVRSFFNAHRWKINVKKTVYTTTASLERLDANLRLLSVDGASMIAPHPPYHTFRYLGLYINLNLDWQAQIGRMKASVHGVISSIVCHKLSLPMVVTCVNQYLCPVLEIAFQFVPLPDAILEKWTGSLVTAALSVARVHTRATLSRAAFCTVSGMVHLKCRRAEVRMSELYIRLCSRGLPVQRSASLRLRALLSRRGRSSSDPALLFAGPRFAAPTYRFNRIAFTVNLMRLRGCSLARSRYPHGGKDLETQVPSGEARRDVINVGQLADWDFAEPHKQALFRAPLLAPRSLVAATDGSTEQSDGSCGWGLVIATGESAGERTWVERCGPILGYTDNYIAELTAVLALLVIVPIDVHLHVLSDSSSAVTALGQCEAVRSCRSRINQSGRPILEAARRVLLARSGRGAVTRFSWVRAHTGRQTFRARMNHRADRAANRGRLLCSATLLSRPSARFDWMEEDVLFLSPEGQCLGRPRSYLARSHRKGLVEQWKRLEVQGELLREGGLQDAVLSQARTLRGLGSSSLLCFFLLGVTQWLPTHHRLYKGAEEHLRKCPFCFCGGNETLRHMLSCPAWGEERGHATAAVRRILLSLGPGRCVTMALRPGLRGSPVADPVLRLALRLTNDAFSSPRALTSSGLVRLPGFGGPDGRCLELTCGALASLSRRYAAASFQVCEPRRFPSAPFVGVVSDVLLGTCARPLYKTVRLESRLATLLIDSFRLNVAVCASPLDAYDNIGWTSLQGTSRYPQLGDACLSSWVGHNVLTVSLAPWTELIPLILPAMRSSQPSRVLLVVPDDPSLALLLNSPHAYHLAVLPTGSVWLAVSRLCGSRLSDARFPSPFPLRVLVVANAESQASERVEWTRALRTIAWCTGAISVPEVRQAQGSAVAAGDSDPMPPLRRSRRIAALAAAACTSEVRPGRRLTPSGPGSRPRASGSGRGKESGVARRPRSGGFPGRSRMPQPPQRPPLQPPWSSPDNLRWFDCSVPPSSNGLPLGASGWGLANEWSASVDAFDRLLGDAGRHPSTPTASPALPGLLQGAVETGHRSGTGDAPAYGEENMVSSVFAQEGLAEVRMHERPFSAAQRVARAEV